MEGRGGEDRNEWQEVECEVREEGEKRLNDIILQVCLMKSYHFKIE